MAVKHIVNLSDEERQKLYIITSKGKTSGRIVKRAQMLLLADEGYPDEMIATMLKVGESTVHRTRQRCVEEGIELALKERLRQGRARKLEGKTEAFLVATACSEPPPGREAWTMQLLADRLVELNFVESLSDETGRRTLKKTPSNLGSRNNGVSRQWGQNLSGRWKTF
jgi:transposase